MVQPLGSFILNLHPYFRDTASLLRLRPAMESNGWLRSIRENCAVSADGLPIPWYAYPCIRFLAARMRPDMNIFEYGAGHSTLWWASRASSVTVCEHSAEWARAIAAKAPRNVEILLRRTEDYASAILSRAKRYDVIAIDGLQRVECAALALRALDDGGVVVWDNSDRSEYEPGLALLRDAGFKRLPFWGLMPIRPRETETSVFYRTTNCLGL